jgi:Domain of unknown function (DUF4157)
MKQAPDTKKKFGDEVDRKTPEERQVEPTRDLHSLLYLQRAAGNRAVVGLLGLHAQTKLRSGLAVDEHEHEADIAAHQVLRLTAAPAGVVQRKCATCTPASKCAECEEEETLVHRKQKNSDARHVQLKSSISPPLIQRAPRNGDSTPTATTAPETTSEPEPAPATTEPLIVEDDAATVAPGQMRKTEFLEQLRATVCTTADEALAEAGQTTAGCPYIEKWLGHYEDQPASHVERALRKFAPEAATAASARDYIPIVSSRVREGIHRWSKTGELPEVPDELKDMMGAGAAFGAMGGLLGGIGSAIGGAVSAAAGAIGGAFSSIGKALFKRKEGHGEGAMDGPEEIQAKLSGGQPLDGGAKSRMGAAFGHDFSDVRVYTDTNAAGLSDSLNARAFTIGSDIAFGSGEYQPGTLIGDALIAHELAHVVQQRGGSDGAKPLAKGEAEDGTLEENADHAAVEAVISTWEGDREMLLPRAKRSTWTTLRSGLRLQRCGGHEPAEPKTRYEFFLLEGQEKLKDIGFGVQWTQFCQQKATKRDGTRWDGYDTDFWVKAKDPVFECKLVVKEGRTSAEAINALFDPKRKDRWQVDCGQFVQLNHYYALLHTLIEQAGNEKSGFELFNQRIGGPIELKQVSSTGLKTRILWGKDRPEGDEMKEYERVPGQREGQPKKDGRVRKQADVLKEAPMGSRVVFVTEAILHNENYRHENTMKVGDDLYSAHPLEKGILTAQEIIEEMSKAADYPEMAKHQTWILEVEYYDLP